MLTFVALAMTVLMGGIIAYNGDLIGRRFGKKRVTLFGLRPRYTAVLITSVTGILISGVTTFVLFLLVPSVRSVIMEGERAIAERNKLRTERDDLRGQVSSLDQKAITLDRQLVAQTGELSQTTAEVQSKRKELAVRTQELEAKSQELSRVEADLKTAHARVTATEAKLTTLNVKLRSVSARNERLTSANNALAASNHSLAKANTSLQAKNEELKEEGARLVRANNDYQQANDMLAGRNETLTRDNDSLEKRNKSLAQEARVYAREAEVNREAAQSYRDAAMTYRTQNDGLKADNEQLVKTNAALASDNAQLRNLIPGYATLMEAYQASRSKRVAVHKDEDLARIIIPAGSDPDTVRSYIQTLIREASDVAKERGASSRDSFRAVQVVDRQFLEQRADGQVQTVQVTGEDRIDAVVSRLAWQTVPCALLAIAVTNSVEEEPAGIDLQPLPNRLIFPKGQLVYGRYVNGTQSPSGIYADVVTFLKEMGRSALEKGVIPRMDPLTGEPEVGAMSGGDIVALVEKIKALSGRVRVRAFADQDINSADPLKLRFEVIL